MKTGRCRTYQNEFVESRREQTRLQEELSLTEKGSPGYSDPKYARNGRNEESSRTTSWRSLSAKNQRKSWDNIKAHFSVAGNARTHEFFSEWFGKISRNGMKLQWRLCYVSSQPAATPSSRSMLGRDKRLPLDTWNTSGLQENVFGNQFSTFDSSRDHPQGIHSCASQIKTRITSTSNRDRDSFRKRLQTK